MKYISIFTAIIVMSFSNCYSQSLPDSLHIDSLSGKVKYEGIIDVSDTKANLYSKGKIWFAEAFKSTINVIQSDDREAGIIIGKGSFDYTYNVYLTKKGKLSSVPFDTKSEFIIKLFLKEGRYKYVITDIKDNDIGQSGDTIDKYRVLTLRDQEKQEDKSFYFTNYSMYSTINNRLTSLISSLDRKMKAKAENDF